MKQRKTLYGLLACVSIVFILYALVVNYIIDPGAEEFLTKKTGLKRELNLPVWLNVMHVHVAFACIAIAAGVLNFSNRIFEKSRKFHRINGYVYLASVLLVVITSGYLAPYATGGKISSVGFNALNILWLLITIIALVQIKKKRIVRHRNWMIRSYAFCFTNMSIHLITSLFHQGFGLIYVTSYTIGVYGSIVLLLIIPDVIIRTIGPSREVIISP
ncbi:DUF2306 domain-containing protein [Paenibacillus xerothermodurans]|uniref:DUF2306 domain-containing protein n=1 Tax=Paenibacillus xerothermodurans TaxID=1977292 RepID=A0A2W1NIZ2_PAEXE|nr:DUF2306 domain-containing protein [Paenibacillus xerothermodurans]PZE19023.1 DUF2306 domain-containing protein [Paenibacillus xerothermodurans]